MPAAMLTMLSVGFAMQSGHRTAVPSVVRTILGPPMTVATAPALDKETMDIESVLNRALQLGPSRGNPIIMPFEPSGRWLWRRWHGTVLETCFRPTLNLVFVSILVVVATYPTWTWPLFAVPDPLHPSVIRLKALDTMWNYLLTLATFVSSFFVSQAYPFWLRNIHNTRKIQGRLNDVSLLLAGHAEREPDGRSLTPRARRYLDETGRHIRLCHILFWAGVVKPAAADRFEASLSILATDEGLEGLEQRGALTRSEKLLLQGIQPLYRHNTVVAWIMASFESARRQGTLRDSVGLENAVLSQLTNLRGTCASVVDDCAAPMPLAYVHFVQVVTDVVLALAPFALFPRLGALSVALSGILGIFYRGLLELSKSFLDPFGNQGSIGQNLQVDCLLGETNAGSVRWAESISMLPFEVA